MTKGKQSATHANKYTLLWGEWWSSILDAWGTSHRGFVKSLSQLAKKTQSWTVFEPLMFKLHGYSQKSGCTFGLCCVFFDVLIALDDFLRSVSISTQIDQIAILSFIIRNHRNYLLVGSGRNKLWKRVNIQPLQTSKRLPVLIASNAQTLLAQSGTIAF